MAIFDVSIYEPLYPGVSADSSTPTVDSLSPTADGGILTGATDQVYAAVNANILFVDVYEPITAVVAADTTAYSADNATWPTADGGLLEGARDALDAEVISAELPVEVGGVVRPPRLFPVVGRGYGVLPELEGEGFGVVTIAGAGAGRLGELTGTAEGSVGVTGRSAAQLVIRAAAIGQRGQAGAAVAALNGVAASGLGTAGAHGAGLGTIANCEGAAMGQHDDDEAAVMAFLLAA